jgi:hypothetical protein
MKAKNVNAFVLDDVFHLDHMCIFLNRLDPIVPHPTDISMALHLPPPQEY